MKFLRIGAIGQEKPAVLHTDTAYDLSPLIADFTPAVLSNLANLDIDVNKLEQLSLNQRIGSCVPTPSKFICIGLNYADHALETGATPPNEPIIFFKAPSALCGPNDNVEIPRTSQKTDWEVELGVVIGKPAKYVDEAAALNHVAGVCMINDVSERAFQTERGGQWVKGKSHDTFAPTGPYLVPLGEIADVANLAMELRVDGVVKQASNTNQMIFKPATIISYLSQFMTLLPGDIISTGTPAGVGLGMSPQQFLQAGQTIELSIAGLGKQKQRTVAA